MSFSPALAHNQCKDTAAGPTWVQGIRNDALVRIPLSELVGEHDVALCTTQADGAVSWRALYQGVRLKEYKSLTYLL